MNAGISRSLRGARLAARVARRNGLLLAVVLAAFGIEACASQPEVRSPIPKVDAALLPLLVDPAEECGAAGVQAAEATSAWRQLRLDGDATLALSRAERMRTEDRTSLAARILRAQAMVVGGSVAEALESLRGSEQLLADCVPLALIYGAAAERANEPFEAYGKYAMVRERSVVAASRMSEIEPAALDQGRGRFEDEMGRGRVEQAAATAELLVQYWPRSEIALRSEMDLAQRLEDPVRELRAVRALQVASPGDRALRLRRGRLEIEGGDPRAGLRLIEELAREFPNDSAVSAELSRSRFEWRLVNAPESVRRLRRKAMLTRSDLATLLYWLVPQARTTRTGDARIASDILDHPQREEIVRIVNLGVMFVDETLHRFNPDAPLRRSEALGALVRLLQVVTPGGSCAGSRIGGREAVCSAALACDIAVDPADCLSVVTLSGKETLDLVARVLERLGVP